MKFVPTLLALTVASTFSSSLFAANLKNVNVAHRGADQPQVRSLEAMALYAPKGVAKANQQSQIAAENLLQTLVATQQLSAEQVATAQLQRIHDTGRGAIVARFEQVIDGIPVFGSQFALIMNRDHQLLATSGRLFERQAVQTSADLTAFSLPVEIVVAKAFRELGGEPDSVTVSAHKTTTGNQFSAHSRNDVELERASSKKVYFATEKGLIPAYQLEVQTRHRGNDQRNGFAYIYAANSGDLLLRKNQTQSEKFAYRVFADTDGTPWDGPQGRDGHPHPTGVKGSLYKPSFKAPNLVSLENKTFSKNDPWLAPGSTETVGNNVDAYVDQVGANGYQPGDIRGIVNTTLGDGTKAFDYTLDTNIAANANDTQKRAAAVEMFYMINWLHDDFYDHGFNETAGNAQKDNFGRGGIQGDALLAEAQDKEGFNNANMMTPSDGEVPRMQMYLYTFKGDGKLTVNSPASTGPFDYTSAAFGPSRFSSLTADLIHVVDSVVGTNAETGAVGTINDGCEPFTNAADVKDKIALIERGMCNFTVKVKNAQIAGAKAAIIYNNRAEAMISLGGDDDSVIIPAIGIEQTDGHTLRAQVSNVTFSEPIPSRDSSFDALTIAHEWGHYITNRMIGNGFGLDNNQGGSLGEGWGDFHALLLTVEADDVSATSAGWDAKWSMGGYSDQGVAANDAYFSGIRGYPYTTDMDPTNGNNLTFKHIQTDPEVHGSGTFWATVLWDCYASLLKNHAFAEAQKRMKDYLVASYAATPDSPTFTEARDALLNVVKANDNADYERMLAAFARRGMGTGATSPDRFSEDHAGVVESFSTAAVVAPSAATIATLASSFEIAANATTVTIPVRWTASTGANVTSYALVVNGVAQTATTYTPSAAAIDNTINYSTSVTGTTQFVLRLCNTTVCTDSAPVSTNVTKESAPVDSGGGGGGGGGALSALFTLLLLPLLKRRR